MENVLPFLVAAAIIGVIGYFIVWKRIINKPKDDDDQMFPDNPGSQNGPDL